MTRTDPFRQGAGASATPSGSRPTDQAPAGLHPSGFDPSRIVAGLSRQERLYVLHTPRQFPLDAGIIAHRSGWKYSGCAFARFVKRFPQLFQRIPNCYGTAFDYRLTAEGAAVADAIATEAGTAETVKQGSVHEGAGPQDIAR